MNKLRDEISNLSSEEEIDSLMKSIVNQKFDAELRDQFSNNLQANHGILRSAKVSVIRKLGWTKIVSIAAAIALLLFAGQFVFTTNSLDRQVVGLIHDIPVHHPGVSKGAVAFDISDLRKEAISAYITNDYAKAAQLFQDLPPASPEDIFYGALARMYNKEYALAIPGFLRLSEEEDNTYTQESTWFLGLALLKAGREEEAKRTLLSIQAEDWKYSEAQRLLKKL